MGPDSLFVKAILLFKIDKELLSVLLNRVIPLNIHLLSICLPMSEEIPVIFCPSVVSIVPFPFPRSISSDICVLIYVCSNMSEYWSHFQYHLIIRFRHTFVLLQNRVSMIYFIVQ